MRANKYEGIQSLQTTVEVGTLLKAQEYLFDDNGDGVIDQTNTEGNFTVNYTKEGRYKPRMTIRTQQNLLYSSGSYALSLDVKADENQTDPVGAQPVDVAKEFVRALIADDREMIEKLTMKSNHLLDFIFKDEQVREIAIQRAKLIEPNSWKQIYHPSGAVTVNAKINDPQLGTFDIGFELTPFQPYGAYNGRFWYVNTFY
ncbi:MAG: hypothetical protein U9O83_07675 [Campylobacterota bacterium]|nr:hypothetical protein [Campylobacterota bacterium]